MRRTMAASRGDYSAFTRHRHLSDAAALACDNPEPRRPGGEEGRALRPHLHIAAGRILDRRQRLAADAAGRHLLGIDAAEPRAPVRPPRALVLVRGLDPVRERD